MALLKLTPACKDYIWGGDKLIKANDKSCNSSRLAETWEVSCHEDGPSIIAEGDGMGETLSDKSEWTEIRYKKRRQYLHICRKRRI